MKDSMPTVRPYSHLLTREIKEMIEKTEETGDFLHKVYVELTHRERKAARELRDVIAARLVDLQGKYFPWPTTGVEGGDGQLGEGHFQFHQGMLGYLGYRAGASGLERDKRQNLLAEIYSGSLPLLNSPEYMEEWGLSGSVRRLRKIAESLAAFVRNGKRNRAANLSRAILDWENDLAYLKRSYYVGKFDFPWPDTSAPS